MSRAPRVERVPAWLDAAPGPLLAWLHDAPGAAPRDCVAVICAPAGHEYTRAHRTLRHLADRLAAAGVPALRFDYHGIGDSAGGDLEPGRIAAWKDGIRAAIGHARRWSGRDEVCLVGVRLGATLAALVAEEEEVGRLVLWNPCVVGRTYVRELQAIAMSAEHAAADPDGALESAGFTMSAETVAAVRALDLRRLAPRATRAALVAGRDDAAPDDSLARHLASLGVDCEYERLPGWAGMMADHQFTEVPDAALERIVQWVARSGEGKTRDGPGFAPAARVDCDPEHRLGPGSSHADIEGVEEHLCRFGADGHLFGIVSRPRGARADAPAMILLNAGSIHHVGPNRLYVLLAR
ncbi:MAG TPA: alpha/beta hydrolase, partial [Myxococcota bacterium]|nr:alpha/beta hydrolase [Myxococcota bacterium]